MNLSPPFQTDLVEPILVIPDTTPRNLFPNKGGLAVPRDDAFNFPHQENI
ncbi:hypothetical protein FH603_5046 [Spirosoma sp. LMG 31447]|uniref:Uncharacterized protein n=1 Tax=Spirosoma utsteinense TaxID=2585773 RepID=A0ABR6WEZ9_9BACT|nr:hypothetical protein [Spirosoma utsteinense]